MNLISSTLIFVVLLFSASFASSEELSYNLVNLSSVAHGKIENDVLLVTMSSTADADSASEAVQAVNSKMVWAQKILAATENIKKQTLNYQTRPRYQNNIIIGWSASQQLQLESNTLEALTELVGALQEKLQVSSMQFGVTPERKKEIIDALIMTALSSFQSKAQLITAHIGAQDYRIVSISVGENVPELPRQRGYAMEAMAMSGGDTPYVEAGESRLAVRVDGTIQLIF